MDTPDSKTLSRKLGTVCRKLKCAAWLDDAFGLRIKQQKMEVAGTTMHTETILWWNNQTFCGD